MAQRRFTVIADRDGGTDNNFNLLRMLAATGVLVSHAYPIALGPGTPQPLTGLLQGKSLGELCVMIFFAISGFFIARSFARSSSLRSFVMARILRLFPALAVVLLVTILAGAALTVAAPVSYWAATPEYFIRNLTLFILDYDLPGVFADNPYGPAINGSLWTLKHEVLCYIGVLICGVLGLMAHRARFALTLLAFGAAYGLTKSSNAPILLDAFMTLALPFAAGMSFWVWRSVVPLSAPIALLAAVIAALSAWTPLFLPIFTLATCYIIFVLGFADIPGLKAYNRLGDYSYGTYVYAFPVQQLVVWLGVTGPFLNMAAALPPTLLCAMISWHLIEAPALKLKRSAGGQTVSPRRQLHQT